MEKRELGVSIANQCRSIALCVGNDRHLNGHGHWTSLPNVLLVVHYPRKSCNYASLYFSFFYVIVCVYLCSRELFVPVVEPLKAVNHPANSGGLQ